MTSSTARSVVGLVSLATALMFERFAYYGVRAVLVLMMVREFHFDHARAAAIYGGYSTAVYFFCIVGAVIAALVGPRISLIIGMGVTAFGVAFLIPVNQVLLIPAVGVIAFGSSLARVSLFAAAGGLLRTGSESLSIGVVTLFYCAVNMGAFLAPLGVGSLSQSVGFSAGMALASAGAVLALAASIAGVLTTGIFGDREVGRPVGLVGALIIVAAMVPIYVLMETVGTRQFSLAFEGTTQMTWFPSLNPLVIAVSGVVTAAILIIVGARRSPLRAGWILGAGAIVYALAALPTLLASPGEPALMTKLIVSAGAGAVGEQIVSSAAIAIVITCAAPRVAALAIGALFTSSYVATWIAQVTESLHLETPLIWTTFGATLFMGVLAIPLGGVLYRMFFVHGRPQPEAAVAPPRPAM